METCPKCSAQLPPGYESPSCPACGAYFAKVLAELTKKAPRQEEARAEETKEEKHNLIGVMRPSRQHLRLLGVISLAVATLAASILYVGSPYFTIHRLRAAAASGDHRKISEHVDFPALRESIRSQISLSFTKKMSEPDMRNNPFAGVGMALGSALIGPMVESLVSPQAIAAALTDGQMRSADKKKADAKSKKSSSTISHEMSYDGLNRFLIRIKPKDDAKGKSIEIALRRSGLFHWQIHEVSLPLD